MRDLRFSLLQLWKNPGFALTAILSVGLGIGAATTVFSVVYGVLVNPYPYKQPERMVHLVLKDRAGHEQWPALTGAQVQRLRETSCVEAAIGQNDWSLIITGEDLPENVDAIYLTANAFDFFGVPPLLGRQFLPSDAPAHGDAQPVAVLSYAFWQRHFGGNPGMINQTIQLVHKNYTIIGVARPRMNWGPADVYLPLTLSSDPQVGYSAEIRLKPGVTYAAANGQLQPIFEQFAKETPTRFPKQFRVDVQGLNEMFVQRLGKTLYLLLGAVLLLLLIGCANVSILLMARGHELAVRAAVGASRFRIFSQLLTEALTLSLGGAAVGVLLASQGVETIARWLPENSFPVEAAIGLNLPVLLFGIGLAVGTSIVFGLSPAIGLSRPEIAQAIQANTRKATGGIRRRRMNNLLIGAQIALTVVLLTAAVASTGGFLHLLQVGLGYDPHNVMSIGIPVHDNTHMTWKDRAQYFEQLRQRVATLPEVVSAGISSNATPPNNGWETGFEIFGQPENEAQQARVNFVSPEYFSLLSIPLVQGRMWDHAETMRGARLAVINQTLARQYWPKGSAVGRQIRIPQMKSDSRYVLGVPDSDSWFQISGVVADARDDGLRNRVLPGIYVPYTISMQMHTQILVRTKVPPLTVLHSVRAQVMAVDPDQQIFSRVRSLDEWITTQPEWAQQRLVAALFFGFAVLALLLAAVGLYSVVSYTVAQRTSEIGIRMSLGARRNDVLRLVFTSTAFSLLIGLGAGTVLSVGLNKLFEQWTEGSSRDPLILAGAAGVLLVSAAAACFFPARRASSVDPMIAVRCQ